MKGDAPKWESPHGKARGEFADSAVRRESVLRDGEDLFRPGSRKPQLIGGGTSTYLVAAGTDGRGAWKSPSALFGTVGSAGQVLGSNGTTAAWKNFPASLYFQHLAFDPADAQTYYFGAWRTLAPATSAGSRYVLAPRTGVIRSAHAAWLGLTAAGSNQDVSIYVRNVTAATEELIATVGSTAQVKAFVNYAMTLAVTQGDALEIKLVCPTWTTNPTGVDITTHVHIS